MKSSHLIISIAGWIGCAYVALNLLYPFTPLRAEARIDAESTVVISEIFAHSDDSDAVELHNIGDAAVDISGWLLTDKPTAPVSEWARIPNGTMLAPGAFYVSWEKDRINGDWQFGLSEAGETLHLLRPNPEGGLPLPVESVRFGASPNGVSFIRYVDSSGRIHYPLQAGAPTLGAPNRAPRSSAVIIEEIMHHPPSGAAEYVVIANITSMFVNLHEPQHPYKTWKFVGQDRNGSEHDMFVFPPSFSLAPNERVVLTETSPQALRQTHALPAGERIFQWERGGLSNSGDRIYLFATQQPEIDDTVNYFVVDQVEYNFDPDNGAVWPESSGNGQALGRIDGWAFANDVANWRSVSPLQQAATRLYLPLIGAQ